jgi:antitoxin ParD1/3/4
MNINFPPVDDSYIKKMVESGYYSNATELVRDAVRRLRERGEDGKHARLKAALAEGERDIAAGRMAPYTPEFLDECEARARENLANGKKLNPDVLP